MTLKSIFIPIFLILSFGNIYSQNLEFYREDICFEIKDQYFYVDGVYYFCNVGKDSVKSLLFYPFPNDSTYGKVDSIYITSVTDSSNAILDVSQSGAQFVVRIKPYGSNKFNISYRQKISGGKAEYILLTTRQWGKPFEQVNYKLILPDNIKVLSLSYLSDSSYTINHKVVYLWHKENFMPDKNMMIEFNHF